MSSAPQRTPQEPIPQAKLDLPGAVAHGAGKAELYIVDNFLPPEECAEIAALVRAQLRPSTTTTPLGPAYDPSYRTSRTCDLSPMIPAVGKLDERISRAIGFDRSLGEPTQGQHYETGQVFKIHTDFFKPQELEKFMTFMLGQRMWTFMIYLNEPQAGGETEFPDLGLKVKPTLGRAVVWNNLLPSGEGNEFTRHESLPVTAGTKTIITKWFRIPKKRPPSQPYSLGFGAGYKLPI